MKAESNVFGGVVNSEGGANSEGGVKALGRLVEITVMLQLLSPQAGVKYV